MKTILNFPKITESGVMQRSRQIYFGKLQITQDAATARLYNFNKTNI